MHAFLLNLIFSVIIFLSESATIKRDDTLQLLQKDVAQVGSAIENITFDVLRQLLEESEETTTTEPQRSRRSVEDDVKNFCQKRCEAAQAVESQHIKELKSEVKKLQDTVKLLQDQQKIIDILDKDKDNSTKQTRAETETENEESEELTNTEQLERMKKDIKDVIKNLNDTRELIDLQKRKDEILEEELLRQSEEISKLKTSVAAILLNTTTNDTDKESHHASPRVSSSSSDMSSIRKLLKSLPEDDEDDEDLDSKLLKIQKELKKKRRQQSLFNELKQLERGIKEDGTGDSDLLKEIIKALKKTEPQSRNEDREINNLDDLQDAINRLRPKENDVNQFQAMLTKLIASNSNNRPQGQQIPQFPVSPQQMSQFTQKLTQPNGNSYPPYFCVVNDGGIKNNGYRPPINGKQFYSYPPDYNQKNQQFFPSQPTPQNTYPQVNADGPSYEKSTYYPPENADNNRKYQEDLKQQIDGLQSAIDNMNRPEYFQKPEDKVVVEDLEKQIADLRNIVSNLNYNGSYQARRRRSVENNKVEDSSQEIAKKMSDFVGKILNESENSQSDKFSNIQKKIDDIKSKLVGNINPKTRESAQSYSPPLPQIFATDLFDYPDRSVKSSSKNDIFVEIIGKILDKIISAIPIIFQKFFNFSLQELSKYDSQDYDVQILFKNLGIFAYLPVIFLRILKGVGAFLKMLRKIGFFKNFLMPAIILGTVAGSVLFLIWWLQPDDVNSSYNGYIGYDDGYNQNQNMYSNAPSPAASAPGSNQYPVSYNYPLYNKNYYNK